jgi:hypothetical protein
LIESEGDSDHEKIEHTNIEKAEQETQSGENSNQEQRTYFKPELDLPFEFYVATFSLIIGCDYHGQRAARRRLEGQVKDE